MVEFSGYIAIKYHINAYVKPPRRCRGRFYYRKKASADVADGFTTAEKLPPMWRTVLQPQKSFRRCGGRFYHRRKACADAADAFIIQTKVLLLIYLSLQQLQKIQLEINIISSAYLDVP
ncbi:hypothetical protein ACFOW1_00640 [Parasediminibacterium paludis]|uniref:Uncharacterized protein n=1 Tax=Parasediminibacterium paludis TaxID=908966 RepID=A0ABV8PTX6_9BACT